MPSKSKSIKITDLRSQKPWLKKLAVGKYDIATEEKHNCFLIVCEGQSEELYFKSFPVITLNVEAVKLGFSKTALVECAIEMNKGKKFDEVWCVFDMDYKGDDPTCIQDFNNAIQLAFSKGFHCAYSNDAFELWFVLHYQIIEQQQLRHYYYQQLSAFFNINYIREGKTRNFCNKIYEYLVNDNRSSQASAIKNAEKLYEEQKHLPYHKQNPVTTIYKLVSKLNSHLRP